MWTPTLPDDQPAKHLALLHALKADLAAGRVRTGDRLPPARTLAQVLGLAQGTVARAYREAAQEGLVSSEVGRGTFVTAARPATPFGARSAGVIDLSVDHPLEALDPDPGPVLEQLARRSDRLSFMSYHPHQGSLRARSAGVAWLQLHGLAARAPEHVVVCAGSQHAALVALASVTRPGDTVLVEALAYPGIREIAPLLGLTLAPVEIDNHGLIPEALVEACGQWPQATALYTVPSVHNPTTAALPLARREAIAAQCARAGLYIVEDDIHRLHADERAPALAELLPERAFYIAGLSKTVAPGLRCAYLAPPPALIEAATRKTLATHWTLPPLMAEIAAIWIEDGTAQRVCTAKADEAAARQRIAADILHGANVSSQRHSFYLWLDLPEGWSGDGFALAAARRGVAILGDPAFRIGQGATGRHGSRVCLGAAPTRERMTAGLDILADLLKRAPDFLPGVL